MEDVLLVLGALGVCRCSVFFLLASGSGGSPGAFCGDEGIERRRSGAEQLAPEAGELEIEDGDLLGAGDDAGARGVIDVVVAEDVDRGQGIDERQDLPGADRQTGVAQPPAEGQQVGPDQVRRRSAAARAARRRSVLVVIATARSDLQQGAADEVGRHVAAHAVDVLLVLEDDAERVVDGLLVEIDRAEREQRPRPVERLGHARRLEEVDAAQPLGEGDDLARQVLRRFRHPRLEDAELLVDSSGSRSSGRGSAA